MSVCPPRVIVIFLNHQPGWPPSLATGTVHSNHVSRFKEQESFKMTMTENSNLIEITDANFATEIEGWEGLAVVDFWAEWCGPCRMVAPIVRELADEYAGRARVGKLDTDANQETTVRFGVRSIPSILFYKDGRLVDTVIGAVPKASLQQKIEAHL